MIRRRVDQLFFCFSIRPQQQQKMNKRSRLQRKEVDGRRLKGCVCLCVCWGQGDYDGNEHLWFTHRWHTHTSAGHFFYSIIMASLSSPEGDGVNLCLPLARVLLLFKHTITGKNKKSRQRQNSPEGQRQLEKRFIPQLKDNDNVWAVWVILL